MNKIKLSRILFLLFTLLVIYSFIPSIQKKDNLPKGKLNHLKTISGRISPKSIVYNGKGLFFAQNMMYRHTVTVYNRSFKKIKTISDKVRLKNYGEISHKGEYRGAPVECDFSHDGKYAWVSNYEMRGGKKSEFNRPGCDGCSGTKYDESYVYKINTTNFKIEEAIKVGSVPKYVATTPNNKYVLVSNWTSGDLSVIDTEVNKEIKRIELGRLPRGIIVNSTSTIGYVTIMGSNKIAKVNLKTFEVSWIKNVGRGPRHLCISPDDKSLYATINSEGKVAKINLETNKITYVRTGRQPRSMDVSEDGKFLYVVNYSSNKLSKIETTSMKVVTEVKTNSKPIGITFDDETHNVWVACYTGNIMVFHDTYYDSETPLILANEEENTLAFLDYDYTKTVKKPIVSREKTLKELAKLTGSSFETKENINKRKKEENTLASLVKPKVKTKNSKNKELIKEKTSVKPNKVLPKEVKGYLVVAGSFRNKNNAIRTQRNLKVKGYEANILYSSIKDLHMVYVVKCSTRAEANRFRAKKRLKSWVFHAK